jgi:anti-sigma-K factor RskA
MNERDQKRDERNALAAEYALGVLDSVERRAAEDLLAHDPTFVAAVEDWRTDLAPLAEEATAVLPPSDMWSRVEAELGREPAVRLEQRWDEGLWSSLAFWRGLSLVSTGAAAAFAALLLLPQPQPAPVRQPRPQAISPMAAAPIVTEAGSTLIAAAYDPSRRRMIVTPTGSYEIQPTQSLELWIIVGDAAPRSLGVIDPSQPRAYQLPDDVRSDLAAGAALAISVEPSGGSPTGAPTGPVVAQGQLTEI